MPPRAFPAANSAKIVTALGGFNIPFGPGTIAAIVRRIGTGGSVNHFICSVGATGATSYTFRFTNDKLGMQLDGNNSDSVTLFNDPLKFMIVAATKSVGTNAVRFHQKYLDAASPWVHENGSQSVADSGGPNTSIQVGTNPAGTTFTDMDIVQIVAWNVVLTDSQIEGFEFGEAAWWAVSPVGWLDFDQGLTTQPINDKTGKGAKQSSTTGTAISTWAAGWSPGDDLIIVTRGGGAVNLTPAELVHTRALSPAPVVSTQNLPASLVHARVLTSGTAVSPALKPAASLTHTRAIGGVVLSPKLYTASLLHTRGIGGVKLADKLTITASLVHTRALNTPVKLNVALKPTSIVHTRVLGSPSMLTANTLLPNSLLHTRAIGGVKLNYKIYVGSIVHARALGSLSVIWTPPPADLSREQLSYGAWKVGMFQRHVIHR